MSCLLSSLGSIRLTVCEELLIEEFQDGGHLGYRTRTILAILQLHVATMPPTKFQLNPAYGSGGDVENVKLMTDDRRTTYNRPWHKLTWSKAPG